MSGFTPASPASTGLAGFLSSTKGIIITLATTAIVLGGVGVGAWQLFHGPQPQVVQRSTTKAMGVGTTAVVAACRSHETLLGGGYDAPGAIVTRSDAIGGGAWVVEAVSETGGGTLTAYALCINAALPAATPGAYQTVWAYHDRADKQSRAYYNEGAEWSDLTLNGPFKDVPRWPGGELRMGCAGHFTPTAFGFYLDGFRSDLPHAPVPFFAAGPQTGASGIAWMAALNNGAALSGEGFTTGDGVVDSTLVTKTLINLQHQGPRGFYNETAHVRPICVGGLKGMKVASGKITVDKRGSALGSVSCPAGALLLGGGFVYPNFFSVAGGSGDLAIPFLADGWLLADRSAPTVSQPSGAPARTWYVHGVNQQRNDIYANSVEFVHDEVGEVGYMADNGSLDPRAENLRLFDVPARQDLTISALCGRTNASPTEPGVFVKIIFPTATAAPTATPTPLPTATPVPTAAATATPTPTPIQNPQLSVSPNPVTWQQCAGQLVNAITVTNAGGGTLSWQASPSDPSVQQSVQLIPANGTLSAGLSTSVTLTGQWGTSFTITFNSDGGNQTVTVNCQ